MAGLFAKASEELDYQEKQNVMLSEAEASCPQQ